LLIDVVINGEPRKPQRGRLTISGNDLRQGEIEIEIRQREGNGRAYASALLSFFDTNLEQEAEEGTLLAVRRKFDRADIVDGEKQWRPIKSGSKVTIDDELRLTTIVETTGDVERVMVESPLPAGTEPRVDEIDDDMYWDYWFGRREMRDDRVSVAASHLYGDEYEFVFRLRPTLPGRYRILPAKAFPMYNPDKQVHSLPFLIEVVDSK